MAGHRFFGKQRLCYTEVLDFTDYQGIGHDPLYKRYDSVFSVVKGVVNPAFLHFLATPDYDEDDDRISWYIEKWNETPVKFTSLSGDKEERYRQIKDETISQYKKAYENLNGDELRILASALKYVYDDNIYCCDGKVYLVAWGMTPDTHRHHVEGSIIHELDYVKKWTITFDCGENGDFESKIDRKITRVDGTELTDQDLPKIIVKDGFVFEGWNPSPQNYKVTGDTTFTAKYKKQELTDADNIVSIKPPLEEEYFECRFHAGENGKFQGAGVIKKKAGTNLIDNEVPIVESFKGYKFVGWDKNPKNYTVNNDTDFYARYEENLPWWRRWWLWLTSLFNRWWLWLMGLFGARGCLKWLLWALLFALLLWLLSYLLGSCVGCSGIHSGVPVNGVLPVDTVRHDNGRITDNNGYVRPITEDGGKLPEGNGVVAPIIEEDGNLSPIESQPGAPNTIANRLFLFLENENDDIESLAQDFKKVYPEDKYSIIGYDREVKLLVIQIPENEREIIRKDINGKLPNHKFIVFDEEVYELNGSINTSSVNPGWHLSAIHLKEGWAITKGSSDIKVAVVDDGIDPSHPMFDGRIVEPYNVFTQNNVLSKGDGHGTHVAGLAIGSDGFYSKGAAGVAPNCKLIPVQVFDNRQCPLSALVAGVMYAVHHDADVVNLSICPSFKGLNMLPPQSQDQIARQHFKNVERLWSRVCSIAARKKCILVFAAGNDDILASVPPENRNLSSIVVTAVDKNMYPTDFTNYGPCSDISAPGKDIMSAYPNNSFKSFDGTSMAAPIVSGTVALMKSLKKDLTVDQARNVLYKSGADVYGYIPPMVLVDKALQLVKQGDFGAPEKREAKPVPENEGDESSARTIIEIPIEEKNNNVIENPEIIQEDETDYDAIRRQIKEHERKIKELKKLLPEEKSI